MNEKLLYKNKFVKDADLDDIPDNLAELFEKWYEKKQKETKKQNIIKSIKNDEEVSDIESEYGSDLGDLQTSNPFLANIGAKDINIGLQSLLMHNEERALESRIKKERASIVAIDSRDRDITNYPKVNDFKVFLGRIFRNVKSIELVSMEIANTEGVIREGVNDKIYWINEEDADLGFPVYSITIDPGSYTALSLERHLIGKFRDVKRRNGSGAFHYFTVDVNLDTDIVTCRSFELTQLPNNPLTTTAGTGIITITSNNHGYVDGELVEIIGARRTSGIPASTLNGSFIITFISTNQFSYEVNVNAVESIDGGGNTLKTGKGAPFQLHFGDYTDTIGPLQLGFPVENSSELLNNPSVSNPLSMSTLDITDVTVGTKTVITSPSHGLTTAILLDVLSIAAGNPTIITTTTAHNLITGDVVVITNTNTVPEIPANNNFSVTVLTTTSFSISFSTTGSGSSGVVKFGGDKIKLYNLILNPVLEESNTNNIFLAEPHTSDPTNKIEIDYESFFVESTSIAGAYMGTSKIVVNHNAHGFNTVTGIENNGSGKVKITTQLNHGFIGTITTITSIVDGGTNIATVTVTAHGLNTGDDITIEGSDSTPSIDGNHFITKLDNDSFNIVSVGGVTVPGTTGTVKNGDKVTLTGTDSVPTVDSTYNRIEYVSDTEFNILNLDPNDVFPTGLTTPGTTGIVGVNNQVILYRVEGDPIESTDIGGITISEINNNKRPLNRIIDDNNYEIIIPDEYSDEIIVGGGDSVRVSSEKHGLNFIQSNTSDGERLNRSITLEGENYAFLTSPELGTVSNSESIPDVFAKIIWVEPPGIMTFSSYVSEAKVFDDSPLPELSEMRFTVKAHGNRLYNFNEIDYSFSLKIVEYLDVLKEAGLSTQRGVKDYSSGSGEPISVGIGRLQGDKPINRSTAPTKVQEVIARRSGGGTLPGNG